MSKRFFICALSAVICILAAQAQTLLNYPLDTINGEEVYVYQAQKADGEFGLRRTFNLPKEHDFKILNPQLKERGIQLGETLYIPTGRPVKAKAAQKEASNENIKVYRGTLLSYPLDTVNGEEVYVYQAQKADGEFGLRRTFNLPKEHDFKILNPQLREHGIQLGETLYIPTGRPIMKHHVSEVASVSPKETIKQPKEVPAVPEITTEQQEETSSVQKTVIAQDPNNVRDTIITRHPVEILETDTTADGRCIREYAIMLPFESRLIKRRKAAEYYIEFYQGALLALHDLQNDSTLYRLRVYDVEQSDLRVNALCDSSDLNHVIGIMGLTNDIQVARMADWCTEHHVPLLLPFTNDPQLDSHPQVLQFNSTERQEATLICQWLMDKGDDIHCVAIDAAETDQSDAMKTMRQEMEAQGITCTHVPINAIRGDSAFYALNPEKENLIIFHHDMYRHVRLLMPHIIRMQNAGYRIRILSQYSWQRETINLPQVYTSIFTSDASLEEYETLWNETFVSEHASEAPRYDLLGYDLMRTLVAWTDGYTVSEGLQSIIRWEQAGEGGWQNTEVHVVENTIE